ncbi:MAG TPA: hypothetical protein VFZ79_14325 [Acidimicrobiales bacterium]
MGVSLGIDLGGAACAAARAEGGRAEVRPVDTGVAVPAAGDVGATAGLLAAVAAAVAGEGAPPVAVAITYAPGLEPGGRDALARAASTAFDAPLLVPRPVAAAAWHGHGAGEAPTGSLAVVLADATGVDASIVHRDGGVLAMGPIRALGRGLTAEALDDAADLAASLAGRPADSDRPGEADGSTPAGRVVVAGDAPLLSDLAARVAARSGLEAGVASQPAAAVALGAALLAATAEGRSAYGLGGIAGTAGVVTLPAVLGPAGAPQGALAAATPAGGAVGAQMGEVGAQMGEVGGAVGDAMGSGGGLGREVGRLQAATAPAAEPAGSALGRAVGAGRRLRLPLGRPKRPVAVGAGLAVLAGALVFGAATVVAGGSGGDGGSTVEAAGAGGASPPAGETSTTGPSTGGAGGSGGAKPPPVDPSASSSTTATVEPGTVEPGTGPTATGETGTPATGAPGTTAPGSPPPPGATTTTAPPRDTAGPSISGLSRSPADIDEGGSEFCTRSTTSWVSAAVSDPSGVASVTAHWSTGGASGSVAMSLANNTWQASIAPGPIRTLQYPNTAAVTWYVTATDGAGNRATSGSGPTITLHGC